MILRPNKKYNCFHQKKKKEYVGRHNCFFYLHYTVQESNLNRACPQMAIQIIGQVLVETHVFFWPNDKGNFYVGSHWPNDKGHFYVGSLIQATQKQN